MADIKPIHFVLSDLHLGHGNILKWGRPEFKTIEEHDQYIIDRINATVRQDEVLWLLGDVAFNEAALEKLDDVKCQLRLVGGNHDGLQHTRYYKRFNRIRGAAVCRDAIFTHIPIHPDSMRWKRNVHGHLHQGSVRISTIPWLPFKFRAKDPRYINVCCEHLNYTPVRISSLLPE